MTHPTDEELDALVKRLISFNGDGYTRFAGKTMTEQAADAITALRAQLAEARADLTFMTENRNKWQDSATQRWFCIEKANSRARKHLMEEHHEHT